MDRKKFLKGFGLLTAGIATTTNGFSLISEVVTSTLTQSSCIMCTEQNRFSIVFAVKKIGAMTPSQLDRCLFESGLSEPFDLNAELTKLVEQGLLKQTVSADGLVYKLSELSDTILNGDSVPCTECLAKMDAYFDELKIQFEAEKDYIAQYTESSTGIVPVFLSIRKNERILLKVNLIVPDVATAKVVTRNWMRNAHKTHQSVWSSIGEGLPFPVFMPLQEGKQL